MFTNVSRILMYRCFFVLLRSIYFIFQNSMKRFIMLAAMFFCLFGVTNLMSQNPVADKAGYIVKVGDMAPDFEMTLTDGTKVKLSSLRGKVVMLQFTASWCGVCRKEMPFIESDIWQ